MDDAISGKSYGDKGYISETLTGELLDKSIELITTIPNKLEDAERRQVNESS